jgi:hypothetical protein
MCHNSYTRWDTFLRRYSKPRRSRHSIQFRNIDQLLDSNVMSRKHIRCIPGCIPRHVCRGQKDRGLKAYPYWPHGDLRYKRVALHS